MVHPWLPLSIKVWKVSFRSMISPYYEVLTDKCRHISIILAWFRLCLECSWQCFSTYGSQSKLGLQSCSEWVTKQFCESTYYWLALFDKYIKSRIFCECNHVYWHCSTVGFITMFYIYIYIYKKDTALSLPGVPASQQKVIRPAKQNYYFFFWPKLLYGSQNVHNFRNTV